MSHGSTAVRAPSVSTDEVWRVLARSFAVIGHVTPVGEPRSSGVLCAAAGSR